MSDTEPKLRKHLNADALRRQLADAFQQVPDARVRPTISLADALMSGFALFALKDPSLLAFDERRNDPDSNLHSLFGIQVIPSDSQLRDILDAVDPEQLRPCFTALFRQLQRGNALARFAFLDGAYLLSFDGTGYFSSRAIHCPNCQVKHSRDGSVTFSHQLLSAVIVHPDLAEVVPLMPEPIQAQDGADKNDCEFNAARRFFAAFRRDHPSLKVIAVGDGLTSKAPLIRLLEGLRIGYILVAKPGDHTHLFAQVEASAARGHVAEVTRKDVGTGEVHRYRWINGVALNGSNEDVPVNFLEFRSERSDGSIQTFTWVTDRKLTEATVREVMLGGRARWKVENETHNTLKNQGYHCEHNFGHGKRHLCVVFVLLMLLAFAVDQIQQLSCELFGAVLFKMKSKRRLWAEMRHLFHSFRFASMEELLEALRRGIRKGKPELENSS
jgi:hypothetical protein